MKISASALVLVVLASVSGCAVEEPFGGPLWGDPCIADRGPDVISGCIHPEDGSGDQGWGSQNQLGICAPPTAETLRDMPRDLYRAGMVGSCRPFCAVTEGDAETTVSCQSGTPVFEAHGLAHDLGVCYCADPAVDRFTAAQIAG